MILILITATASVAVYLAICLRFLGSIVGNDSLLNHTPRESWAEFHPPPQVSQVGAIPFAANTRLICAKRLSKGGVFSKPTTIVCISFITFLYSYLKARRLSFCMEGTDALHQMIIAKEDGFITIIVGASLLA